MERKGREPRGRGGGKGFFMVIGERPLSTLHSPRNDGAVDRSDEKRAIQRSAIDRSQSHRCRKKND